MSKSTAPPTAPPTRASHVVLTCADRRCAHTFEPDALTLAAGDLGCPVCSGWVFHSEVAEPVNGRPAPVREYRTELVWAPATGSAWSERPGWTLYVDGHRIATTSEDLSAEAAQRWANTQLGEGLNWSVGHGRWYFVATPAVLGGGR